MKLVKLANLTNWKPSPGVNIQGENHYTIYVYVMGKWWSTVNGLLFKWQHTHSDHKGQGQHHFDRDQPKDFIHTGGLLNITVACIQPEVFNPDFNYSLRFSNILCINRWEPGCNSHHVQKVLPGNSPLETSEASFLQFWVRFSSALTFDPTGLQGQAGLNFAIRSSTRHLMKQSINHSSNRLITHMINTG